jgi:hypothetical protein
MDRILAALVDRIINLHDSSLITTPVAIVWSRKDGYDTSIMLPLVTLHNKLMRTSNEMKSIDMSKLFCNILPKRVPSASR